MNFLKQSLIGAAVTAALSIASTANAGVVIDLFTDPVGGVQTVGTSTLNATGSNQAGPFATTGVIGGYRDLSITKTFDNSGNANVGASTATVDSGVLQVDNATGNKSTTVVTWDGSNVAGAQGSSVNTIGLGGIDLTAGGTANQILAIVEQADLGFDYKITVWDLDGRRSTLQAGVQFQVLAPVTSHYLLSWFSLASGNYCDGVSAPPACANPFTQLNFSITRSGPAGAIDFTRVGAMQLELFNVATASVDLALGSVSTVPEPGALSLAGLALLGLGVASRRRAKKA